MFFTFLLLQGVTNLLYVFVSASMSIGMSGTYKVLSGKLNGH